MIILPFEDDDEDDLVLELDEVLSVRKPAPFIEDDLLSEEAEDDDEDEDELDWLDELDVITGRIPFVWTGEVTRDGSPPTKVINDIYYSIRRNKNKYSYSKNC